MIMSDNEDICKKEKEREGLHHIIDGVLYIHKVIMLVACYSLIASRIGKAGYVCM